MTVALAHTFHDGTGEVASGAQLMENLTVLKACVDPMWGGGSPPLHAAPVTRSAGVEYEPSSTRPVWVLLEVEAGGENENVLKVLVGGVLLPEMIRPKWQGYLRVDVYPAFLVPMGKKWKWEGSNITLVNSVYWTG